MDRRRFISGGAQFAVGSVGITLIGCGQEESAIVHSTVLVNDIQTYGGFGIPGGVLPRSFIETMRPVQLAIYEGSHFHTFSVGTEEYEQLLSTEVVTLTSDIASGHTHSVTLDPNNQPTFVVEDVTPYDSRYGEGGLEAGTITATQIIAGDPVTLVVDEGGHQHDLVVSTQNLMALRAGITVYIDTAEVSGHTHPMKLDPNYHA